MKILMCCALLVCLPGCIPIGIRGTSITATELPSCIARSEIETPLRPGAGTGTGTTGNHPRQAAARCA
jgi:hypothetical protein